MVSSCGTSLNPSATACSYASSVDTGTPKLGPGLELVAAGTERVNVPVCVLATHGQRAYVVNLKLGRTEVAETPRTPATAPTVDQGTQPCGTLVPFRSASSSACTGTDRGPTLVCLVVSLAAAPMGRSRGTVNTAHVRPLCCLR